MAGNPFHGFYDQSPASDWVCKLVLDSFWNVRPKTFLLQVWCGYCSQFVVEIKGRKGLLDCNKNKPNTTPSAAPSSFQTTMDLKPWCSPTFKLLAICQIIPLKPNALLWNSGQFFQTLLKIFWKHNRPSLVNTSDHLLSYNSYVQSVLTSG